MNLTELRYWIFDMDGTLTVPIHDFLAIRKELGIPLDQDILSYINSLPADIAQAKHARLEEIELEMAYKTEAQEGIHELLSLLVERNFKCGIITRNNRENTQITLEASGLLPFFGHETILTRECSAPKPAPDAIHHLINLWDAQPNQCVIIGDYRHDLEAGRAAGIHSIYFDSKKISQWNSLADLTVQSWQEIHQILL